MHSHFLKLPYVMNKQEKYRLFKEFMKEKEMWKRFNDLYKQAPIGNTPLYLLIYDEIDRHKLHRSISRIVRWPYHEVSQWRKLSDTWEEYCELHNL